MWGSEVSLPWATSLLWLFFPFGVLPAQWIWDLIILKSAPAIISFVALCFDVEYLFLVGLSLCHWLFGSSLWFWCFCDKRGELKVFLLHHLVFLSSMICPWFSLNCSLWKLLNEIDVCLLIYKSTFYFYLPSLNSFFLCLVSPLPEFISSSHLNLWLGSIVFGLFVWLSRGILRSQYWARDLIRPGPPDV